MGIPLSVPTASHWEGTEEAAAITFNPGFGFTASHSRRGDRSRLVDDDVHFAMMVVVVVI
jgi:hypothetical protein